jgi:hypothetical protein
MLARLSWAEPGMIKIVEPLRTMIFGAVRNPPSLATHLSLLAGMLITLLPACDAEAGPTPVSSYLHL